MRSKFTTSKSVPKVLHTHTHTHTHSIVLKRF